MPLCDLETSEMHCVRQVLAELCARSMGIALLHQGYSLGWVRVYLIKNNSITGRVTWVFQFISCLCLFLMEGENQWKCDTKEFSHTGLQWSHSKGFKPFPIAGSWFWNGLGVYFLWSFLEDLIHSWDAAMKSLCLCNVQFHFKNVCWDLGRNVSGLGVFGCLCEWTEIDSGNWPCLQCSDLTILDGHGAESPQQGLTIALGAFGGSQIRMNWQINVMIHLFGVTF